MSVQAVNSGRLSLAGYAKLLKVVVRGGATWRSVSKKTGARRLSVQRILHYWNDVGLIHVRGWEIPGGVMQARCPIYKFGPGVNVPWPGGMLPRKTQVRADPKYLRWKRQIRKRMVMLKRRNNHTPKE